MVVDFCVKPATVVSWASQALVPTRVPHSSASPAAKDVLERVLQLSRKMTEVNSLGRSRACIKPCLFLIRQRASPAVLHPVLCPGSPNASLGGSRQNCSPLGTHWIRVFSISINILWVLSLCLPRIRGELSAGRWALRILLVLFICWKL